MGGVRWLRLGLAMVGGLAVLGGVTIGAELAGFAGGLLGGAVTVAVVLWVVRLVFDDSGGR